MLDMLGQRYSTLPSKLLESGNIVDLKCAEIAIEYGEYQKKNRSAGRNILHKYSADELAKQLEAVRKMNE
jgi:hypothetical protein